MKILKSFYFLLSFTIPLKAISSEDVPRECKPACSVKSFSGSLGSEEKAEKLATYERLKAKALELGLSTEGGIGALKARIKESEVAAASGGAVPFSSKPPFAPGKETPLQYEERKARLASEKFKQTQNRATRLGINVSFFRNQKALEQEIKRCQGIKDESEGYTRGAMMRDAAIEAERREMSRKPRSADVSYGAPASDRLRPSKYSEGSSRSGYRPGSASDPEAAERILKGLGPNPSYAKSLEARHAYATLHPESRKAYDPDWDG